MLATLLLVGQLASLGDPPALLFSRGGRPTPQALESIHLLETADEKGLEPADYDGSLWRARLATLAAGGGEEAAAFDAQLQVALRRYASDVRSGRVDPRRAEVDLDVAKDPVDLAALVREAAAAPDVAAVLASVEPPHAGYRRLLAALAREHALAGGPALPVLPEVKRVEPGGTYAPLAALAETLVRMGDLAEADRPPPDEVRFQGPLVAAVRRAQERHGLAPDGILGVKTLRALAVPPASRVRQIALTLERWRWAPSRFDEPPIVVNIPEFRLRAYDESGRVALSSDVVVGRTFRHQTPVLAALMRSVVFHPSWSVPLSITRRELLADLAKDPLALAKGDYEVVTAGGGVSPAGPLDETTIRALRSGSATLRQRPGPKNALGRVKFVFPNRHDVYLHDTPARSLFGRARRDFSHGCIRVRAADELAAWVLRGHPAFGPEAVRAALEEPRTLEVRLPRPIPVLIVYGTAVALEDGTVRFFDDIYGLDAALERAWREAREPQQR